MKSIIEKEKNIQDKKRFWLFQPIFLLILFVVIITFYIIVIRPYLMPTMLTSKLELIVGGVLLLALGISSLITIGILLVTTIIAIITRTKDRIRLWLLKFYRQLIKTVGLFVLLVGYVILTQKMAYTPPIVGLDGKSLPNSIASLEKITLGDSEQWITLRGKNKNNPVLLFLAGGPGGTRLAASRDQLKELEEYFVVVNWDQPGAGKSYHSVPIESITTERYISDVYELTQYLTQRFNQEKIYVLGESWGSALGILMVERYPELYHALIGTGQMVSFVDTEEFCYDLVLNAAKERDDIEKVEQLEKQGPPPYFGDGVSWKSAAYMMDIHKMMVNNPLIVSTKYDTFKEMAGSEYGLYDKINFLRGILDTFNQVYPQLYGYDFRKQVTSIDVPVYFLVGRHDLNAPPTLVQEYYEILTAPQKELIWFEHSGHTPWINESDEFVDVVVNTILKETM